MRRIRGDFAAKTSLQSAQTDILRRNFPSLAALTTWGSNPEGEVMNNPNQQKPGQQQQNNPRPGEQQGGGGQKPGQQQQGGGQQKPGQQPGQGGQQGGQHGGTNR
jgi:hypothetical protein